MTDQNSEEVLGYREHPSISNSDLKIIAYSPQLYKKYKEGNRPESTKAQSFGSMVDMYILDPEKFNKEYVYRATYKKPASPNQENFANLIAAVNIFDFQTEAELDQKYGEIYRMCYKVSASTDNKTVIKKAKDLMGEYKDYIDSLTDPRTPYNEEQKLLLEHLEQECRNHPVVYDALYSENSAIERHAHYRVLDGALGGVSVKGELDLLVIDNQKKQVRIFDIKTTSKSLASFPNEFMRYDYHVQLSMYLWLVANKLEITDTDWEVECCIIALETQSPNTVGVFPIPMELIKKGFVELNNRISLYKFYEEHGYDRTKSFVENKGYEVVNWNEYS